jgi:predicted transcriptional regulator
MKNEKVTFDTAKLAKEKGFNEMVEGSLTKYLTTKVDPESPEGGPFGWIEGELETSSEYFRNNDPGADYSCKNYIMYGWPTQAQLQRWLRDVHNIQVYCYSNTKNSEGIYRDYVVHVNERAINDARDEEFQTYEEAMEVGLQVALEMI